MTRHSVWHVALEPIDGRYSKQWLECIKPEFEAYANKDYDGHDSWSMYDLVPDREEAAETVTKGGFLNFTATNRWKSQQVIMLSRLFEKGYVCKGDTFLFTDAWNPAILNVRYMADLLEIPIRIVSYWHAGSYDPWDVLGYKIKDKSWSYAAEVAFYNASDVNVFATEYHRHFFLDTLPVVNETRAIVSGQPHYKIIEWFDKRGPHVAGKENIVLFPHRLVREKQPEIFNALEERCKFMGRDYKFIRTQDLNLTKGEYYSLMIRSKVVFSCAQHEMLGIAMMEGVLAGCIPMVPKRLSYQEIYAGTPFLYPSIWSSGAPDLEHLYHDLNFWMRDNGDYYDRCLFDLSKRLKTYYLTSEPLFQALKGNECLTMRSQSQKSEAVL